MLNKLLWLQHKNPKKVIGLMSGTSADGIDACLVEIFGNGLHTRINLLAFETCAYDNPTRTAILDVCHPETGTVDKVCRLNFYLGKLFAKAAKSIANKALIPINDIDLIGSHGQTIYHLPERATLKKTEDRSKKLEAGCKKQEAREEVDLLFIPSTLQIGEPSIIAQETGVTTVADFRPRDMAAGGQGAPLVPYVDFLLFRDGETGRALQNIGGIANVTVLPQNCKISDVIAFDTGPGNMIIDHIAALLTNGAARFDDGGELAAKGSVDNHLLAVLLSHPYLSKPPPKTTGREEFGKSFADKLYKDAKCSGINDVDILATVTAFTAYTIADSYKRWILHNYQLAEIIISGGGCRNNTLIKFLRQYINPAIQIHTTDKYGISPVAREALAFAILANEAIFGNPNNVPNVTGARESVVMGKIIPG